MFPNDADVRAYVIADVFTSTPLEGNQLAVFTDGAGLTSERMQRVARELNLSETVFVLPAEQGGDARIRIFTPSNELPFAGHPVLGSAFVIGTRASGRMIGEYAGLQSGLDKDGNLVPTADFRAVYSSLVEQWFGVDAKQVLPDAKTIGRVQLLR